MKTDRRTFIELLGASAVSAAYAHSIRKALAIPAHRGTGTIKDVEHIVILMQENRSFDHYFGTLRGVRGFGDPRAVKLPSGRPEITKWPSSSARTPVMMAPPSRLVVVMLAKGTGSPVAASTTWPLTVASICASAAGAGRTRSQ